MATLNSIAVVEKKERFESVREVRFDRLVFTKRSFATGKGTAVRDCLKIISRCLICNRVRLKFMKRVATYFNVGAFL